MALSVCNWNDKQLDELVDMLLSADYSAVATFIANNFLCAGSRIMIDDTDSNLRATVGVDTKTVVLSTGVLVHDGKCSQLDTNQVVNILFTTSGTWGTGQAADGANPRWDIICVKNNEQAHTPATRWFVNDSTVPNTYYTQSANTLLNKAYYDIVVVHGTADVSPVVPDAPSEYWTIAEIYVPALATTLLPANVYDTTDLSNKTPANWTATTRVLRMEFWGNKFGIDHDPATGYHRDGLWHIGSTAVTTNASEINQALDGVGITVTASNLTKLTDGSVLGFGELHRHGDFSSGTKMVFYQVSAPTGWTKDVTQNDKALRVVSGDGGGIGGTHGLSVPPDHIHTGGSSHRHSSGLPTGGAGLQYTSGDYGGEGDMEAGYYTDYQSVVTGIQSVKFSPAYIDVIVATKN